MTSEYHKIAGPFKRDPDNLKKLTGQFVNPAIEQLANAEVWIAREKLDGMNIRIIWDGHKITYGGRTDKAIIPGDLIKWLDERLQTPGVEEYFEENFGEREVILVGEGVGAGIQKGGACYSKTKHFMGFDVMVDGSRYLSYENSKDIFDTINLPFLASQNHGLVSLNDIMWGVKNRVYGWTYGYVDYVPEGIVAITPEPLYDQRGHRLIVKIKDVDFHED